MPAGLHVVFVAAFLAFVVVFVGAHWRAERRSR